MADATADTERQALAAVEAEERMEELRRRLGPEVVRAWLLVQRIERLRALLRATGVTRSEAVEAVRRAAEEMERDNAFA